MPNFRTLHYRFSKTNIDLSHFPKPEELPQDLVIVLDSTGLKVSNRGELLRKKHGKKARKGGIKLHVAFELNSGRVVELEITDEKVHDSQRATELV